MKLNILGVEVHPLTIDHLNLLIAQCIESGQKQIFAHHNLHSVYLYHKDQKLRSFYSASNVTYVDGMSLIFCAKLLRHRISRDQRMGCMDWIASVMSQAEQNQWSVFYLGSTPEIVEAGGRVLRQKFPGLRLATHHGYFEPIRGHKENEEIIRKINAFVSHILLVGMGMPRQEYWILDNFSRLKVNVILPCGSCLNYVAGVVPTPPRWLGKLGLEWLFRLFTEPRRLWRRYLIEPWTLLPFFGMDIKNRYFF